MHGYSSKTEIFAKQENALLLAITTESY